jgi:hypothetical protein
MFRRALRVETLLAVLGFCVSLHAGPQQQTPPGSDKAAPIQIPVTQPNLQIVVIGVEDPKSQKAPTEFSLGKTIRVTLAPGNLKLLQSKATDKNRLELFLNGIAVKGLDPIRVLVDPDSLRFYLTSNDNNRSLWNDLYSRKARGGENADKVSVALGLDDLSLVVESSTVLTLEYLPDDWAKGILALSFVILIVTVVLGYYTSILRDSGAPRSDKKPGTFSLARVQMALWFVTIVFAFLFLYAVKGDPPPITQGVLILMGIGAGTALGASAIDENKKTASSSDLVQLTAEKIARQREIEDLTTKIGGLPANDPNAESLSKQKQIAEGRFEELTKQLGQTSQPVVAASAGFFEDILTDVNGISFHRLQILGWTLVFWVMFLSALFTKLTMTEFDITQLALMGISSSTYLGFKLTEKQS